MSQCACPDCVGCTQERDLDSDPRCGLCRVDLHEKGGASVKLIGFRSPDYL